MKAYFFISMLVAGCISSAAASPYYYCQGEKIPLTEVSDRMSVAVASSTPMSLSSGYSVVREIKDNSFRILVCEDDSHNVSRSGAISFKAKLKGVSTAAMVSPCYKSENGDNIAITPYLNVKLKKAADYTLLEKAARENNLTIVSQDQFMPLWYILSVTTATNGTSLDIANKLYESGQFAEAIADFSSENDALCSYDPFVTQQWGLYNPDYDDIDISICGAWSYATGRGIKIGILDQGVDVNHIDLAQNIYPLSFDTESGTSPAKLYDSHGTHCAGIAAAVRNNGIQVAGVAPDAKIVSISNSLRSSTNSCPSDSDNFYIVNYDGTIHKCNGRTLSDETREGYLNHDGNLEWDMKRRNFRLGIITFDNEACRNCKILPLCMGPCSQKLIESGAFCKQICSKSSIDMSVEDYLSAEFEMRYILSKI